MIFCKKKPEVEPWDTNRRVLSVQDALVYFYFGRVVSPSKIFKWSPGCSPERRLAYFIQGGRDTEWMTVQNRGYPYASLVGYVIEWQTRQALVEDHAMWGLREVEAL